MKDLDVIEQIGAILRPHCDLDDGELQRVSESVLLIGARHALAWVEEDAERGESDQASYRPSDLGSGVLASGFRSAPR